MKRFGFLASMLLAGVLAVPAFGQAPPQGGGGDGGGNRQRGGDRGNMADRMAEWRERQEKEMKEQLGVTDEEYKALQPRIEKVQQLQMQAMAGRFGGGRGGFGRGGRDGGNRGGDNNNQGGSNPQPANPVAQASQDLRTALENKDTTAADIKNKLEALRAARAKSHEELIKAQTELKELLSQRQEAVLVSRGVLE